MGLFERLAEEAKKRWAEREKALALARQKAQIEVRVVPPWEALEQRALEVVADTCSALYEFLDGVERRYQAAA